MDLKDNLKETLLDLAFKEVGLDYTKSAVRDRKYLLPLRLGTGLSFLDVGCGSGALSHYLAVMYNYDAVALDSYDNNGNRSEACFQNYKLKELLNDSVEIVEGEIMDYKPEKKFDVIYAHNSMHHIVLANKPFYEDAAIFEYGTKVFRHLRSLLKADGVFIMVDVPPITEESTHYENELGKVNFKTKHMPAEWVSLMSSAGFLHTHIDLKCQKECDNEEKLRKYVWNYMILAKNG